MADESIHARLARQLMQHRTELYAFIFACLRNHHDTEDLLQTVSVAVMEAAQENVEPSAFLPWAREIAWRRILAHRRSTGRHRPLDPSLVQAIAEAAGRVDRARPASAFREALLDCLGRVPEETRRVLEMRYDGSVSGLEELAARVGRSVQGVYALLKRGKAALRECMQRRMTSEARG